MVKAKCNRCGWKWESKSKAQKVSCPGCGAKVNLDEFRNGKADK